MRIAIDIRDYVTGIGNLSRDPHAFFRILTAYTIIKLDHHGVVIKFQRSKYASSTGVRGQDVPPDQMSPQTRDPRTRCPPGHVVLGPDVPHQDRMSILAKYSSDVLEWYHSLHAEHSTQIQSGSSGILQKECLQPLNKPHHASFSQLGRV